MKQQFELPSGIGDEKKTITVEAESNGISIGFQGCGLHEVAPGFEGCVYVEFYDGKPRVIVWGNINDPDPTHVIELDSALESNRQDGGFV